MPSYDEMNHRAAALIRSQARKSTSVLLSCVYKSERTHRPVIIPPHQKVAADFMDAHTRSVHIWPVNHGKTGTGVGFALRKILENPNSRGVVVSATQAQAKKVLRVLREYIEGDADYRWLATDPKTGEVMVRRGDMWTDSAFTVARSSSIKDPTVAAVGIDGGMIMGSRIDWALVDDLLTMENTYTRAGRDKTFTWLDSSATSRMENDGQIAFMNSAWHPDDAMHRLEKQGVATLRMAVDGAIYISDDIDWKQRRICWDSPLIEDWPGGEGTFGTRVRLTNAAKVDYSERIFKESGRLISGDNMLWDPHPTIANIHSLEIKHPIAKERKRLYYSSCRDDGESMVKESWIDDCKKAAQKLGFYRLPKAKTSSDSKVVIGVDLAVGTAESSGDTVFFVVEILPSGHRLVLEIVIGKMGAPEIRDTAIRLHQKYDAIFRVENNGVQEYMLQIIREKVPYLPVRPHTTGRNKAHAEYGIPGLFAEIAQAAWLLPCGDDNIFAPEVQRFVDACLYYHPEKHTDDTLMGAWFAREQARSMGLNPKGPAPGFNEPSGRADFSSVMRR